MSYPYYGQPAYPPVEHPKGTTILVLGILSLVVCGVIGPFAWVMGNRTLREIDASGYAYSNRSMVQAGRICGIVSSSIMIFVGGLYAIALIVMGIGFATGVSG